MQSDGKTERLERRARAYPTRTADNHRRRGLRWVRQHSPPSSPPPLLATRRPPKQTSTTISTPPSTASHEDFRQQQGSADDTPIERRPSPSPLSSTSRTIWTKKSTNLAMRQDQSIPGSKNLYCSEILLSSQSIKGGQHYWALVEESRGERQLVVKLEHRRAKPVLELDARIEQEEVDVLLLLA